MFIIQATELKSFLYTKMDHLTQGLIKGEVSLFDWIEISCMTTDNFSFYLQNRLIQTSQTGGQLYSDTSPFSIPCLTLYRTNSWLSPKNLARYKHSGLFLIPVLRSTSASWCWPEFPRGCLAASGRGRNRRSRTGTRSPWLTGTRSMKTGSGAGQPGDNVIKLFMSVIYEFSQ